MRGHSHPTMCEELEKGGEARPASHTAEAAAAITGIHIHHMLTNSAHKLGENVTANHSTFTQCAQWEQKKKTPKHNVD